jgi:uncharacterized protein (DUF1778 family)
MPAATKSSILQTRLSARNKRAIEQAAKLRNLSVSDYLRQVLVPMAEREVEGARHGVIEMTPDEQLAFWQALNEPASLTAAQKELARLMRGDD